MGALAGSMADVGIDDDFIKGVQKNVTPGTSALFVMTSNAVADKVLDQFKSTGASLLSTNLSTAGGLGVSDDEVACEERAHPVDRDPHPEDDKDHAGRHDHREPA
jgi:hypothetical protein